MTEPLVKGNKGGRPLKSPDEGKRSKFACRMTGALRARVAAAAEEAGRSLSEEMEHRIEASFRAADIRQIVREEISRGRRGNDFAADWLAPVALGMVGLEAAREFYDAGVAAGIFRRPEEH